MIEELNRINLVDFMQRCWQVSFVREGARFVALSPFRQESTASFYVQEQADGHWVYFDHGSGRGGTIIDAVMDCEGLSDVSQAIARVRLLAQQVNLLSSTVASSWSDQPLDLEYLVGKMEKNACAPVREYLVGRGIAASLVDSLVSGRQVVHNRVHDGSYCCFVIRDAAGCLRGLFNRKIAGPASRDRFLLGRQHPFCLDWDRLVQSSRIHVCESIIDGLSVQTLDPEACVLCLPGACYDVRRLAIHIHEGPVLVDAFDADESGRKAARGLREHFCSHTIDRYDLQGYHDVNDLLCMKQPPVPVIVRDPVVKDKLTVPERLEIVLTSESSRTVGEKYGVHHSRICDIRSDAKEILTKTWAARRPGRKTSPAPSETEEQLLRELAEVKARNDLLTMRNEWLELEVKQSEKRIEEAARQGQARKKKRRRGKKAHGNN